MFVLIYDMDTLIPLQVAVGTFYRSSSIFRASTPSGVSSR